MLLLHHQLLLLHSLLLLVVGEGRRGGAGGEGHAAVELHQLRERDEPLVTGPPQHEVRGKVASAVPLKHLLGLERSLDLALRVQIAPGVSRLRLGRTGSHWWRRLLLARSLRFRLVLVHQRGHQVAGHGLQVTGGVVLHLTTGLSLFGLLGHRVRGALFHLPIIFISLTASTRRQSIFAADIFNINVLGVDLFVLPPLVLVPSPFLASRDSVLLLLSTELALQVESAALSRGVSCPLREMVVSPAPLPGEPSSPHPASPLLLSPPPLPVLAPPKPARVSLRPPALALGQSRPSSSPPSAAGGSPPVLLTSRLALTLALALASVRWFSPAAPVIKRSSSVAFPEISVSHLMLCEAPFTVQSGH